jgi:CHAT domain-containing protein
MHRPFKSLSLVTTTLLISLASPVYLKGISLKVSDTPAQAQTTQDRNTQADRLVEQGNKQLNAGQREAALQSLQQALTIYRELQDRQGEGQVLKNLGNVYYAQKDYAKAIESQQQALAIAREIRDRELEWSTLNALVRAYDVFKDYQKVIEFAQQGLTLARETPNRQREWESLSILVSAYNSLENYEKAVELAQQGLVVARELQNRLSEWSALVFLTKAHISLEEYEKTIEYAQQSLALATSIKNSTLESGSLILLSAAYLRLKDYQKTIEFAQQSLAIAKGIPNHELESAALEVLSAAYWSLKDYQKGIEFVQERLAIAQKINDRKLESKALYTLGGAYWRLRYYRKSIEYHQQALGIYRELKDRRSELSTLYQLIANYFYLGDYQKVIELAQQQLALAREIKNYRYEGYALAHLGFAYYAQGDSQKLIEFGQQALAVGRENKSPDAEFYGLLALSIGHANLGNNEKALEFSQASLAIARDPKAQKRVASNAEELALNIMGSIHRKAGRKEPAIIAYRESLAINDSDFNAKVGLARIYHGLNMPVTAITYYKQAISSVEQIRGKIPGLERQLQESFLQAVTVDTDRTRNADIYRELADLLLSQGRILEAQQVLELLKVQELREFTGNRRAGGETKETAFTPTEEKILQENGSLIAFGQRLYECQQSQCSQLSQLLDQRQGLTEQFNQKVRTIEKDVRDRRAQDDGFFDPTKLAKAKEIVEAQSGTVLIYPFVLEDKIWLLLASKGGVVKSMEVPVGRRQLGETVLKFRQLLQNPSSNITEVKATSKQLYDWLIKRIEPELKANQIQNLVFSLDSVTRYIPMSALFDGEKYLIENYAVSTVLSADLTDMRDRLPPGTQNTSVLALGLSNAVAGFNPLPNVPAELDAIVRQNPSAPQGIYSGLKFLNNTFDFRALRDNLLGHKVLHIATHGEFVPGRQEESYLLLGTGEKLTIPQVKTLQDLSDVHLVVLSACQTALGGPNQDGVEISGISYYFLNSGAKAVMASLWLVSDDSTRLLMQNFYGNLAKGTAQAPMTKTAALQQAQLSLLHGNSPTGASAENRSLTIESRPGSPIASTNSAAPGFSHPYYWAPFILIGNGL